MVGDENQSIYRFRNADLEVFRERAPPRAGSRPTREVLPLRGNFRSLPGGARRGQRGRRARCSTASAELDRRRASPTTAPGAVELLLTLDEGSAATRAAWDAEEIDLDPPPSASPPRIDRRGALPRRAAARAGRRRRGRARRDRRPAARLHPRRRLRGGARARRPAAVRRRRARLLDPAAGRGPDPAARRRLQPARRRVPVRRARLVRGRRQPRRALAAAPRGAQRSRADPRHVWPVLEWRFGDGPEPGHARDSDWLEAIPADDAERLERFCAILARPSRGARRCCRSRS